MKPKDSNTTATQSSLKTVCEIHLKNILLILNYGIEVKEISRYYDIIFKRLKMAQYKGNIFWETDSKESFKKVKYIAV